MDFIVTGNSKFPSFVQSACDDVNFFFNDTLCNAIKSEDAMHIKVSTKAKEKEMDLRMNRIPKRIAVYVSRGKNELPENNVINLEVDLR